MKLLLKTNDPSTLSFVQALMREADLDCLVLDEHMSILEGSIGAIARRVMVADDAWEEARAILKDADLGHELEKR